MGCCRRNFNTDEFKAWLSTLHEEQPGTEFCIKEDDQKRHIIILKIIFLDKLSYGIIRL